MHFACVDDESLQAFKTALGALQRQLGVVPATSDTFASAGLREMNRLHHIERSLNHQWSTRPRKILITTRDIDNDILRPHEAVIGTINFDDVSLNDLKRICEAAWKSGHHVIIVAEYEVCYSVIWRCNESTELS